MKKQELETYRGYYLEETISGYNVKDNPDGFTLSTEPNLALAKQWIDRRHIEIDRLIDS